MIIAAAMSTTTKSGETGATTAPTTATVTITASSLYLTDVAEMKLALDDSDVEEEDRYLVITPTLLSSALQQEKISSADYAAVKALVNGEIDTFMGFKWITSTRIAAYTTLAIEGLVYHKNAICLAMASQPMVRTDERKDLSYSWQVYYELNCGAVRLEEDRIRKIRA